MALLLALAACTHKEMVRERVDVRDDLTVKTTDASSRLEKDKRYDVEVRHQQPTRVTIVDDFDEVLPAAPPATPDAGPAAAAAPRVAHHHKVTTIEKGSVDQERRTSATQTVEAARLKASDKAETTVAHREKTRTTETRAGPSWKFWLGLAAVLALLAGAVWKLRPIWTRWFK